MSVSAEVTAQILSLASYYDGIRDGLGVELEEEVQIILHSISQNPHLYQKDFGRIRRAYVKRFQLVIFYVLGTESVGVVEVRDARREPPDWVQRGFVGD
jgi:hypothetical protein